MSKLDLKSSAEAHEAVEFEKAQFFKYIQGSNWAEAKRILEAGIFKPSFEDFKIVNETLGNHSVTVKDEFEIEFEKSGIGQDGVAWEKQAEYHNESVDFAQFYEKLLEVTLEDQEHFSQTLDYVQTMDIPDSVWAYTSEAESESNFGTDPESVLYTYFIKSLLKKSHLTKENLEQVLESNIGFKFPVNNDGQTYTAEITDERLKLLRVYVEKFADEKSYELALRIFIDASINKAGSQEFFNCILKICRKAEGALVDNVILTLNKYEEQYENDDGVLQKVDELRSVVDTREKEFNQHNEIDIAGREVRVVSEESLAGSKARLVTRKGDVVVTGKSLTELLRVEGIINIVGLNRGLNERQLQEIKASTLGLPENGEYDENLDKKAGQAVENVKLLYEDFINHPRTKELGIELFDYSFKEQGRLLILVFEMSDIEWHAFMDCYRIYEHRLLDLVTKLDYSTQEIMEVVGLFKVRETNGVRHRDLTTQFEIDLVMQRVEHFHEVISGDASTATEKATLEYGLNNLAKVVLNFNLEHKGGLANNASLASGEMGFDKDKTLDFIKGYAYFGLVSNLFEGKNIDLEKHAGVIKDLEGLVKTDVDVNNQLKKILFELGYLQPVPEVHWRVDRDLDEYKVRANLNIEAIIREIKSKQAEGEKFVVFEIGPGNGRAKRDLEKIFGDSIEQYAVCDKIYFPLSQFIEKVLDFTALEKEMGGIRLTPEDREAIADYVYRVLVIQEGKTHQNKLTYDEELLQKMRHSVEKITEVLAYTLNNKLGTAKIVPSTISGRDEQGNVIYPEKVELKNLSMSAKKALQCLVGSGGKYIQQKRGLLTKEFYKKIDADITGVIFSDMHKLSNLKPGSVDLEIAMRSSVYFSEEKYQELILQIYEKLSLDGITIDDSIRNNDGNGYRLDAAYELKRKLEAREQKIYIYVVMGPGFETEDYQEGLNVPKCMVMTKNPANRALIEKHTYGSSRIEILEIDELVNTPNYIGRLNRGRETVVRLRELKQKYETRMSRSASA